MTTIKLRQLLVTRIDDTPSLRLARVVNQAEDAKMINQIEVFEKVAKLRCDELDKEIEALQKFLENLKITTGYLKDSSIMEVWGKMKD